MPKIKFLVKSPLEHDKERYAPGATIEFDDAAKNYKLIVQPLLAAGTIEPVKKAKDDAAQEK